MEKKVLKDDIKKRLNRIEGQVRGIHKMVDNDDDCSSVLIQIAAVRAAINKVGGMILENYAQKCVKGINQNDNSGDSIDNLIDTMLKFMK